MVSSLLLVLARSPAAPAPSAPPPRVGVRAAAAPVLLPSAAAASAPRSCCRVGVLLLPTGLPLGVVLAEEVPAALRAAVPPGPAAAVLALPGPVLAAVLLLPADGVPRSRTSPLRLSAVLLPAAAASRSDLHAGTPPQPR
jgi:hypothetical protein